MAGKAQKLLAFNTQAVLKAKPKGGKLTEHKIDGVPGLTLVVQPSGVATYFVRYQVRHGNVRKFRRERIGRRDLVSLHEARKRALAVMTEVARGADPVQEDAARRKAITFRMLFEERRAKDGSRAPRTLNDYQAALEADVFPALGDMPAGEITREQIARVLESVEARSKHAAHKARCAIGSTYRWALKRSKVRDNPTLGLGYAFQSKPRNRVFSDGELAKLWRAIDAGTGLAEPMRIILKLAILTGQRESEVAGALVAELELDTANPQWRIPSERMKRKNREQIVPLSTQAVVLFKRAIELNSGSPYAFPADTSRARADKRTRKPHIHGESVSHAMARLREQTGLDGTRVHDLRRTLTTWLRQHKRVPSDVCDLILHHARKGVTATHYDFATLEGPVREALQAWADHVSKITGQSEQVSNVTPLRRTPA